MKKFSILLSLMSVLLFLQCTNENPENTQYLETQEPYFRVTESTVKHNFAARASYDEPCKSTNLIAGQDFENPIGAVTVDVDYDNEFFPEGNLIITYTTVMNSNWTIDLTHLSVGDCIQSIPTTGSGNPKVGHFEHTEPHSAGTNEVIYHVSLDVLPDPNGEDEVLYCFAAHAEVTGPDSEETAWAEGPEFDGNSWAMFVDSKLSDCDLDCEYDPEQDTDGDGIPDCQDNCPEVSNPEQLDSDKIYNEYGQVIGYQPDGVGDECDNCKDIPNEDQIDLNEDGIGDACHEVK